jgi:hypothetical protein
LEDKREKQKKKKKNFKLMEKQEVGLRPNGWNGEHD